MQRFTKWLHFGNAGWLTSRDPELQDKAIKFLDVLAASIVFSTSIDMTRILRQMSREGWTLNANSAPTGARTSSASATTPPTSSTYPHPPATPTLRLRGGAPKMTSDEGRPSSAPGEPSDRSVQDC